MASQKSRNKKTIDIEIELEKANAVISFMGEGLLLVDDSHEVVLANQAAGVFLRQPPANLVGKRLDKAIDLFLDGKKAPILNILDGCVDSGDVVRFTSSHNVICNVPNVGLVPIILTISPFTTNKMKGTVIVFRDITEEKSLEESKDNFISITSHQLRTPLTLIRWYSEMLNDLMSDKFSEEQKEFVEQIYRGSLRLAETINVMLSIAKVEKDGKAEEVRKVRLAELAENVLANYKMLWAQKNLRIDIRPDKESAKEFSVVYSKLRQVLNILILNAISYSRKGGKIEIKFTKEKDQVVCSVKDNGIGIPKKHQRRIFEKFFRAPNAILASPDGSGLDLALARTLVNSWKGKIWFESAENKGTTFNFSLPL